MSEQSQPYPIYRSLWESLDAVLFAKGMALAKEIALELKVSPKELLASLVGKDRNKFIIIPDGDDESYQCEALVQKGVVYMRCRCPTLGTAPRLCNEHRDSAIIHNANLPIVNRMVCNDVTYLVKDTDVYTLDGNLCGKLQDETFIMFEIHG